MRKGFASAVLVAILLAGAAMSLSACNTTAGFGQDMTAAGQALTHSADQTKDQM